MEGVTTETTSKCVLLQVATVSIQCQHPSIMDASVTNMPPIIRTV